MVGPACVEASSASAVAPGGEIGSVTYELGETTLHRSLHLLYDVLPRELDSGDGRLDGDERADGQERLGVIFCSLDTFASREQQLCRRVRLVRVESGKAREQRTHRFLPTSAPPPPWPSLVVRPPSHPC